MSPVWKILVFSAFAVGAGWSLRTAALTGSISGEDSDYTAVSQPIRFTAVAVSECILLLISVAEVLNGLGVIGDPLPGVDLVKTLLEP